MFREMETKENKIVFNVKSRFEMGIIKTGFTVASGQSHGSERSNSLDVNLELLFFIQFFGVRTCEIK